MPAIRYCRIAHARIYSGTNSAQRNNGNLYVRKPINGFHSCLLNQLVPGSSGIYDMLGCREVQVQRNIVDKQLHTIPQIVRVWINSPPADASRA